MTAAVHVRTPCRLHFGMFSFGHAGRAQFGGVGAMIEPPSVEVRISPSDHFAILGQLADRVRQFVELIVPRWNLPSLPACEIFIQSPRSHTGLGVGTQLGLAVAAGLRRFLNLPELPIAELAAAVGRGARSAVGTHGFERGGLIVDAGKELGQSLGILETRVALPETWRFVLFGRPGERGLAGASEASAFERLPPVANETTRTLWKITNEHLLPAIERRDCRMFGEAVYQFGRLAGECFSTVQGGSFANAEIGRLVESIREFGIPGAGQTSWGPTVFAVIEDDGEAERLIDWFRDQNYGADHEVMVARPNNGGATIET